MQTRKTGRCKIQKKYNKAYLHTVSVMPQFGALLTNDPDPE